MYDIIVIGAGPAGLTAGLYARRADKSVLIIERSTFGGQITHSPRVENYPGFESISGTELADKLVEQVLTQGAEIELDTVIELSGSAGDFTVKCESSEYNSKCVIIATGSHHRTLGLERESDFVGEGISYCAVCDGPFYKDKDVAVVGGGNTALQEAVMLSELCKSVTVIQNLDFLTGEQKLINDVTLRKNISVRFSSVVEEIAGTDEFEGVIVKSNDKSEILHLDGLFIAIGQKPENEPFSSAVALNEYGYIISDETCCPDDSNEGIFVAGDCRTKSTRQVATAIADGAVAALTACKLIDSMR